MHTYAYKAKNGPGQTVDGTLDAPSDKAAVAALDAMGYSPIWVRQTGEAGSQAGRRRGRVRRRVRPADVTLFTGQLATLLRSGVPILRTLRTIGEQAENPALGGVVRDLEQTIRDGSMLSAALAKHPRLFDELYISMVRAGESGGVLDAVLARMTEVREEEEETRRRVQAALAYPLLIFVVGVATVFVLLTFFLPKVLDLFDSYDKLPLPTRLLIGASSFLDLNWHWLLLGVGLCGLLFQRLRASAGGRLALDRFKLRLPLVGRMLQELDVARFARTLAVLLDAGVAIDRALTLARETLRNAVLRMEMESVRDQTIRQGSPLSAGLRRAEHFPLFASNMAAVGEEGGKLDEALLEIARYYEKSVAQRLRLATTLLEPLLILVVGALVGFIVSAMLLPIFELGTTLR